LSLRYWEWGNVPEKTRNEFHAKDATIAKRVPLGFVFTGRVVARILKKTTVLPP
jgi:hypothetical protein